VSSVPTHGTPWPYFHLPLRRFVGIRRTEIVRYIVFLRTATLAHARKYGYALDHASNDARLCYLVQFLFRMPVYTGPSLNIY